MENNKEKETNSKKKTIIIITLIIILAISIIYIIYCNNKLKGAAEFYKDGYFYSAGDACGFVMPIFSQDIKKYKIAKDCGVYYEWYKEKTKSSPTYKQGKINTTEKIEDEIFDLTFGLYLLQRDNKGDGKDVPSSEIEKETVEYVENLYYKELNDVFYISKETVDNEIISKYKVDNTSVDDMKTIAQSYADSYINTQKEKKETSTTPIKISALTFSSNSSYKMAEGTVTNTGNQTVYYVKVKVAFKNISGTTIDTNWTYAVSSEGLEPGESKKFSMAVKEDYSITDATASILNFQYK